MKALSGLVVVVFAAVWFGTSHTSPSQPAQQVPQNVVAGLSTGESMNDVKATLGSPESVQHKELANPIARGATTSDQLRYGGWTLSFTNGKLTARTSDESR